jgi:cell division protein FtsB
MEKDNKDNKDNNVFNGSITRLVIGSLIISSIMGATGVAVTVKVMQTQGEFQDKEIARISQGQVELLREVTFIREELIEIRARQGWNFNRKSKLWEPTK